MRTRLSGIWLALLFAVLLGGCAAENAYRDGKKLIEAGQVNAGLAQLSVAVQLEPNNVLYRSAYYQAKEASVRRLLARADSAAKQNPGDAKTAYHAVLAVEPQNSRAMEGLSKIAKTERHAAMLQEAKNAVSKGEKANASSLLAAILSEDSSFSSALELRQQLETRTGPTPEQILADTLKRPISIDLEDASLRQVFALLGHASGISFMFDKEVKLDLRTSVVLKQATIESALYYTLLTNQLEQQTLDATTVLIYPAVTHKQKEYQEMVIRTFHLSYADAKNVANYLRTFVKSKDIGIDEKLNMVTIRDTADAVRVAEKLVALQDVPESEVMLDVEVLEVNRSRLLQLGVTWPDAVSLTPIAASGGSLTARDLLHNISPTTLRAEIGPVAARAKKQDSDASILANPRIRVRNREKAKVMVGERLPNITTTATATGFISEQINYVDVGLKLEVEPTISLDDDVAIRIGLEVSSIVGQLQAKTGTTAYQLGTRNASTLLSLKDGETQILAGLINDQERSDANKVPGLGQLPLLGRLFGSTTDNGQKTEIVLSITPRLIRNVQRPRTELSSFKSGTDGNFRLRPDGTAILAAKPDFAGATTLPQAATAAPTPLQLQWQGPTAVKVGSTFTVQLTMQSDTTIAGLPLLVQYDKTAVEIVEVKEGDFLRQGGAQTQFSSMIEPDGRVRIEAVRSAAGVPHTPGVLATMNFKAVANAGAFTIGLSPVKLKTRDGRQVAVPDTRPYSATIE